MLPYAAPVLFALFLWWFSTGIILYLDGLPGRTFRWSMLGAAIILVVSIRMLGTGNQDTTVGGAYAAFSFGLLAWGWQEISFYMGMVTGIRTEPCPEGCSGWRHFGHAVRVSIFHELSIIATAAVVFAVVWPGSNHIGLWTYVVLWWMHQSAKLNVLLGVRNLNEDFLPEHMAFLKSFLTKKPMNLLFPVSVTISTVIAVMLFQKALSPGASDFTMTGFMFLGALMALAILEHWFLVLPLPSEALWKWSLKSRAAVRKPFDVDVVAGFLGAGKTTYIRRLLASADPAVRTIVLVNDFGSLGIDASLLTGRGAEIVELPNGCICCSLRQDLAQQLTDAVARWAPRRVIIEPSGVADVAGLLAVLGRPVLAPQIGHLRVCTIVDAGSFLRDYARMHTFFEAQARMATLLIVNKIDVAAPGELAVVEASLRDLNPAAAILRARHGLVQAAGFDHTPASGGQVSGHACAAATSWHIHGPSDRHEVDHGGTIGYDQIGHGAGHALDFGSWSGRLADSCNPQGLQELLDAVARGAYGQIERVKGIARAGAGWVHFDVAGGRSSVAAFAPAKDEEQRVTAIGRALDGMRLQAAFEACAMRGELSC
jgi:putative photosynthetic complex assembly protein 2